MNRGKGKLVFFILLLSTIGLAGGSVWAAQKGAAELTMELGPRPVGMGGAFVALADDQNATTWNPAGLAQMQGYGLSVLHSFYVQDISWEHAAFGQALGNKSGWGMQVLYLNYGSMDKYLEVDGQPEKAGTFSPHAVLGALGYGREVMANLAAGATVKLLSQNIDGQTYNGGALDAGLQFDQALPGLKLGAAVYNLGPKLAEVDLPAAVQVGGVYALPWRVQAADTWQMLLDVKLPFADFAGGTARLGTEYGFGPYLAVRAGYQARQDVGLGKVNGLAFGASLKLSLFQLDYALASLGDLGMSHQVALVVAWK